MEDDSHKIALSLLCRICGELIEKTGYAYSVSENEGDIRNYFYIDVSNDNDDIHPKDFCKGCFSDILNMKKRGTTTEHKIINWVGHYHELNCYACDKIEKKKKGGRPKKRKHVGNPKSAILWTRKDSGTLKDLDFPSSTLNYPPLETLKNKLNSNVDLCVCQVCHKLLNKPIMNVKCQHVTCLNCLLARVEGVELVHANCPLCSEMAKPEFYASALAIETLLRNLKFECKRGCGETFTVEEMDNSQGHEEFCFGKEKSHPIEDVFKLDSSEEIPAIYEEAAVHILRNKMAQSNLPNKSIEFKTAGSKVYTINLSMNYYLQDELLMKR